ncbi:MAG: hypothetical protein V4450_12300 [Bacteroidota bacterium]
MNKRTRYTVLCVAYFLIGITGFLKFYRYAYVEQDSWHRVIVVNIGKLVFTGVISGLLLIYLYKKWLPEEYEKRKNKISFTIFSPIIFIVLGFVLNTGLLFQEDLLFKDTGHFWIRGIVMNKDIQYGSKGSKAYFVSISDTMSSLNYYFKVKKWVYENARRGDKVNKDFYISKLGIIYRKEE